MLIPLDDLFRRRCVKPKGIVHIGAHLGQERDSYQRAVRSGPVIWIEALPDVHAQLKKHVSKYPNHCALLACVGDQDGKKVTFHRASNEGMSSSYLELGTHAVEHPDVKFVGDIEMETIRVDTLLKQNSIGLLPNSFLSIDTQGTELAVLRGMESLLEFFDFMYLEVNRAPLYQNGAMVDDLIEFIGKHGFDPIEFKWTKHQWGDLYAARRKK